MRVLVSHLKRMETKMNKNLWIEESDKYTERAEDFLNDKLFGNKDQLLASRKISSILSNYTSDPKNILDIALL